MSVLRSMLSARHWYALYAATVAAVLVACGGGGGVDTGGTGAAQPSSYSNGSITGFGSVIVNGVRFDTSTAQVTDDSGAVHPATDLKLGMVVDIDGGAISTDAGTGASTSAATAIQYHSEIVGPVQAVNATAGTATVLGQTVNVDANTVFANVTNGLAGLSVGDTVEVYAFYDTSTGTYSATRIEKETGLSSYKVRGPIANVTATTFTVGGATIDYSGVPADQRPTLTVGLIVRVTLQTTPSANVWIATKISGAAPQVPDQADSELEGFVTDFSGLASFKVNGIAVDASGAGVQFPNGSAASLANGVRIEVHGKYVDNVLVADKIEFNQSTHGGGSGNGHGDQQIELHGSIDTVALASSTFSLRGITVHFDANTQFAGGTSAALVVGAKLQVKGNLISGSSDVLATQIEFGDH